MAGAGRCAGRSRPDRAVPRTAPFKKVTFALPRGGVTVPGVERGPVARQVGLAVELAFLSERIDDLGVGRAGPDPVAAGEGHAGAARCPGPHPGLRPVAFPIAGLLRGRAPRLLRRPGLLVQHPLGAARRCLPGRLRRQRRRPRWPRGRCRRGSVGPPAIGPCCTRSQAGSGTTPTAGLACLPLGRRSSGLRTTDETPSSSPPSSRACSPAGADRLSPGSLWPRRQRARIPWPRPRGRTAGRRRPPEAARSGLEGTGAGDRVAMAVGRGTSPA